MALVQMAESVPILSASVEDIIVCCVMCNVRAANGCCRAKHQETGRLMKTRRDLILCSLKYTEKQTALVRGASMHRNRFTRKRRRGNLAFTTTKSLYYICLKGMTKCLDSFQDASLKRNSTFLYFLLQPAEKW